MSEYRVQTDEMITELKAKIAEKDKIIKEKEQSANEGTLELQRIKLSVTAVRIHSVSLKAQSQQ